MKRLAWLLRRVADRLDPDPVDLTAMKADLCDHFAAELRRFRETVLVAYPGHRSSRMWRPLYMYEAMLIRVGLGDVPKDVVARVQRSQLERWKKDLIA